MNASLSPHAANLLTAEYPSHKVAAALSGGAVSVPAPSADLVHSIEASAEEFGITAGTVDWAVLIPQIIAAVASKNFLALFPLLMQAGPGVFNFVMQIIGLFQHKQPPTPAPGTGPAITGS